MRAGYNWRSVAACCLAVLLTSGCAPKTASLTSSAFGTTEEGTPVTRYTMTTSGGVSVSFINYGGIVTDVVAPDRDGRRESIVLGFPTLREYETTNARRGLYFGAIIGRYANFIAGGRFKLDGREHRLFQNYPPNSLHGGARGFDKRIWRVEPLATAGRSVGARLTYTSPDGEEGYPGTLNASVTYTLSEDGAFAINYQATTDEATVVAMTNHLNFNLAGAGSPDGVLRQELMVNADRYLPTDRTQIPLGQSAPVQGSPFDFRRPTPIGARIREPHPQLAIAGGYDHNWVLNKQGDVSQPQLAARVYDPGSGRVLECLTTEPAVLSYTANGFNGSVTGIGGRYGRYAGFTLETQHFPDSPNRPEYPSTVLRPGQVYQSTTVFRFGVRS
ncbi:MAG: Aldose 1-epimerase [uncultured Sphingomonas sp.]|uniref:Aldose 1-epimerase n=1 Tax=uncultured Sphingomonas sp. TaxID=158754 RepID=A0A6J4TFH4_9SPHN|nr:aldose epimerase family protein [uncultured Sphingomonas sp.]CAA9521258.1 MAG: Aldose 1-epimerase [uncultured Sphingomonas sp.]